MGRTAVAHAKSTDDGERSQVVFESRAINKQKRSLQEKKRALEVALAEVNSNLELVHDMGRVLTRSRGKLLTFEPESDVVFAVPMDDETVQARRVPVQVKRAIAANYMEAVDDDTQANDEAQIDHGERGHGHDGSTTAKGSSAEEGELLDVQIRAIMLQHAEDCKRMHASDAGRLANEAMTNLRVKRGK